MEPQEQAVEDNVARTCEVCGAALTEQEIKDARDLERPFLCSVHAAEELPAEERAGEGEAPA